MNELERMMYEIKKLKHEGIMAIESFRQTQTSNIDKQYILNIFKKIEKFLSNKSLSNFVACENRTLYNDIIEIYMDIKKRIKTSQEIIRYENDRLNKKIFSMNELCKIISQLFRTDPTQIDDIPRKLDQVSFVLNDRNVDFSHVDKDLYYRYIETRKTLIDLTNFFREYSSYVIYVKKSYDKYEHLEDNEEKQILIRQVADRYRFINNRLKSFGVVAVLNDLTEIQFFLGEYKKIMMANHPSIDESILDDFGVPENDDSLGNADGITLLP